MSISIAMATHNGERFLLPQLQSLARQTYGLLELVICDDCSSDATLEIVRAFAATAPFEVVCEASSIRRGFSETFLHAARKCRGDLIAFSDQDDVWLPTKLFACVSALHDADASFVAHSSKVVDAELNSLGRSHPVVRSRSVLEPLEGDPWFIPPGFASVFERGLLDTLRVDPRPRSRFTGARMHHDEWVYFMAFLTSRRTFIPNELVMYRQHGENAAGVPERGLERLFRNSLSAGAVTYAEVASLASEYAEALEAEVVGAARTATTLRLTQGAALYRRIARLAEERRWLYERDSHLHERLQRLLRLVHAGAYGRKAAGGFGARALAKDLAIGVLQGR